MSWSFGEVRALAVKAARGAGMSWGMAEEAGFACHWLEQHSLPGTDLLAKLLSRYDENESSNTLLTQVSPDDYINTDSANARRAHADFSGTLLEILGSKQICPLLLGTLISDGILSHDLVEPDAPDLGIEFPVSQAGLLLPFFYLTYYRARHPVALHFILADNTAGIKDKSSQPTLIMTLQRTAADESLHDGQGPVSVELLLRTFKDSSPENNSAKNNRKNNSYENTRLINALNSDRVVCHWHCKSGSAISLATGSATTEQNTAKVNIRPRHRVPETAEDAISKLQAFAARTYAPMTEESREKGAGAGSSDND